MSTSSNTTENARQKRHRRIRATVEGTQERPRLSVYRSNNYMYAQIINDVTGETLASSNSRDLNVDGGMMEHAAAVGKDIAEKAEEVGVEKVVFDRGGYQYAGRVKELAENAREGGLDF